jgi:hypothetical protein
MHQEVDDDAGEDGVGRGSGSRGDVYLEEAAGWGGYRR